MTRALPLLLAVLAGPASAAEAKLAVHFWPVPGARHWYAAALEQVVSQEAARFSRVSLVDAVDVSSCKRHELQCQLELYAQAGIDVVILGELDAETLHWQVYETWTPSRAFSGDLAVGGTNINRRRVQHQVAGIIRPIVASGGLLDRNTLSTRRREDRDEGSVSEPLEHAPLLILALALSLALLAAPLLLLVLIGAKSLRERAPKRLWAATAGVIAALLTAAATFPNQSTLALPVLGGALWGLLAILHLGFVFPPLQGLSRIRHEALGPTLRAYAALCFFRLTALLAWWPLVAVTAAAANAAGLTPSVARLVLLPAVLLTACFFIASLTEHLALYLDSKRVEGPATARNAWHATVRKYFLGYLKRSGIVLQRRFLERALFLPGTPDSGFEVTLYGGALGAPRILIGAKALTAALGELPDEPEGPDRQVNPEELPFGFITPADDEAGPRVEKLTERLRRRLSRAAPRSRAPAMPRLLGEPTTALGWVVPRPVDEAVPLISNTREDYEVVKGLLTEHYGRFEKNLDEDEHDDTDPTQKDFLFGALMVATGGFTRRDNLGATLASAFGARGRTRKVLRALFLLHARVFAWPRAAVADAFAALNQALHPQIQYLHLCRNGSPAVLTARADAPHLVETSKTLLEQLLESSGEEDARFLEPTEAHRMLWLAPFFAARLVRGAPRWLRAVALGAVAAALAAVVVTQVLDAVSYRPTYVERMTQMRAMADKASQGAVSK